MATSKKATYILQKKWFDVPIGTEYDYGEQGRLSYYDVINVPINIMCARSLPVDLVENSPEWFKLKEEKTD